jgi:hypothetical protein
VVGAFAACGWALAGCDLPGRVAGVGVPVDPSSPIAQDVIRASRTPGPYPKFADIPKVPTDVRPTSEWRADIKDMQQRQSTLQAEVAALPPLPSQTTEAFAGQKRAQISGAPASAAPADKQQTEAEARALRKRATPPPPPR